MTNLVNIKLNDGKLKAFLLRSGNKTNVPTVAAFIQWQSDKKKLNKESPNWKGTSKTITVFRLYDSKEKTITKKLLQDTKVIYRNLLHYYTLTTNVLRDYMTLMKEVEDKETNGKMFVDWKN